MGMHFARRVVLASFLLVPFAVSAQILGSAPTGASFSISVQPQYPGPNSSATLSFISDSLDLTNATMAVVVAGKKIYQGSIQPLALQLGRAGSITNAVVTVSSGGTNHIQTISVQPQDVALVVEPISSAPPLYPGKSLVPLEGSARIVAVANLRGANGKAIDPNSLSYAWTVDGTAIANSSGIGRAATIVASPLQYRERSVSVKVQSQDGTLVGGAILSLTGAEPTVRIYENDPLLGIRFGRVLFDDYTIGGSEGTLYAAAFFLPTSRSAPILKWFLNGAAAQTGNLITLRPTGSGQGTASLSVIASSGNSVAATANLSLSFGTQVSTNLFGL